VGSVSYEVHLVTWCVYWEGVRVSHNRINVIVTCLWRQSAPHTSRSCSSNALCDWPCV